MADVTHNVRLDSSEWNTRLRIMMLQASYVSLCEQRGWNFVENAQKVAVKRLFAVLKPRIVKKRIEDALQLEKNDMKYDFFPISRIFGRRS